MKTLGYCSLVLFLIFGSRIVMSNSLKNILNKMTKVVDKMTDLLTEVNSRNPHHGLPACSDDVNAPYWCVGKAQGKGGIPLGYNVDTQNLVKEPLATRPMYKHVNARPYRSRNVTSFLPENAITAISTTLTLCQTSTHWDTIERFWGWGGINKNGDILRKHKSATDGVYTIDPGDGKGPFRVFCDMTTDGGGWVVFQRRFDGSEDFYRTWDEYKNGFGRLSFKEFYLGNERVHRLTAKKPTILRIDLEDFVHNKRYASYRDFTLGDAKSYYKINFGAYSGTAGDSLSREKGMAFSAKDKDEDKTPESCAKLFHGAWWYKKCHLANLNGDYNNTNFGKGLNWYSWRGYHYSLYHTEMKLRPRYV